MLPPQQPAGGDVSQRQPDAVGSAGFAAHVAAASD